MRDPVVKPSLCWIALGLFAYALLPWYALQDGLLAGAWLQGLVSDPAAASALFQTGLHGKPWLGVPGVLLVGIGLGLLLLRERRQLAGLLLVGGSADRKSVV